MRLTVSCRFAPRSESWRDQVRNAVEVVEPDGNWFETYADDCWLSRGKTATVQIDHDTDDVGDVFLVYPHREWWYADLIVESDDPKVLERIKVGAPVSLGARMISHDDDQVIRTRRHTVTQLQHIAILKERDIPKIPGARIMSVTQSKATATSASSGVDWRSKLPAGFRDFAELSDECVVRDRNVLTNSRGSIRWAGDRFVSVGRVPIAA